jgi:ABC-type branched-subunit amino acid transport system permease subunit
MTAILFAIAWLTCGLIAALLFIYTATSTGKPMSPREALIIAFLCVLGGPVRLISIIGAILFGRRR